MFGYPCTDVEAALPSWDRVSCWVGRSLAIKLAGSRDLPVSALSSLGLQTVMVLVLGDSDSGPSWLQSRCLLSGSPVLGPKYSLFKPIFEIYKGGHLLYKELQYSHLNTIHCVNKPKINYLTCLCIAFSLEPSQEKNKTKHITRDAMG